jgi:uncharacterized protein
MKNEISLEHFPLSQFAKDQGALNGAFPLSALERLAQESVGATDALVQFAVSAAMRPDAAGVDEPWLQLEASTVLRLTCQRCLGAADLPVEFNRSFRFVATEALAEVEDEESEEDVLVLNKHFNLQELIEDELLMAMPLVPKHVQCPQAVRLEAVDADFDASPVEKPNPFAVLEKLKSKDG